MKKLILIVCFLLINLLAINNLAACTLAVPSLGSFDKTEYVFIGKVIGYTEALKLPKIERTPHGLVVEVIERVYLPKTPKTYFEIVPYELGADCSTYGVDKADLQKDFPMNSEVRVIAKEAAILPNILSAGNIRLEIRSEELSDISINTDEQGHRMSTATSVFDYKSYRHDQNKDSDSHYTLPNFEIRKDLLRLEKSKTANYKKTFLERFYYAPSFSDLNYYAVLKKYTSTQTEFKHYYESQLLMTDPKIFKQYLVVQSVVTKLIKLGYRESAAEKAIGDSFKKGIDVFDPQLFENCLQILRRNRTNNKRKTIRSK